MPRRRAGLEVSAISLEKGQGGNGVYAIGTVVNTSDRRRSRVTVEFDLLDAGGQNVGIARAYRPVLEPGAKWQLKLPVAGDAKAVSARLASIKEGPVRRPDQSSRSAAAMGRRAPRMAGKRPPIRPMRTAHTIPRTSRSGVTAKAKVTWLKLCQFIVAVCRPLNVK